MKKTKLNTNETLLSLQLQIIHQVTTDNMELFAEIVRIIAQQPNTIQDKNFYWTLAIDDCNYVEMEIILSFTEDFKPVLEIFEVENENTARTSVSYDVIYTLLGYVYSRGYEIKHNQ